MARSKMAKTKLEEEKTSKHLAGELGEKLEAMGQENEELAAKWVIEENDKVEQEKKKRADDTLHFYTDERKSIKGYTEALARHIHILLHNYVDWQGYKFLFESTWSSRGVGVMIQDPEGQVYARGFKPCGEPKYDIHAMKVLIWQTENVVDDYRKAKDDSKKIGNYRPDLGNGTTD